MGGTVRSPGGPSRGAVGRRLVQQGEPGGLMLRPQPSLMSGVAGGCVASLGPFFSNL